MISFLYQSQWDFLIKRWQNNNLPHALLLTGLNDLEFPQVFAKTLLCSQKNKSATACGICHSCQLLQAGSHPDFYQLQPEEAGKTIRIDQIRELISQLSQTAQQQSYKIAIIYPAEALPKGAANALLKTLEEPTPNTLIMLISNQPGLLSATIRSRCQKLAFQPPASPLTAEQQQRQERLLEGLKQLSIDKLDPVQFAATWLKEPLSEIVASLIQIIMERIRLKASLPTPPSALLMTLFSYLDELYKIRQALNAANNLNQQLVLENLFITWQDYIGKSTNADNQR